MAELKYIRGYEVNGVSPLPHYFEEIYGHLEGISKIGPRGDQNYFWYSRQGKGAAYYEIGEQQKSAHSTYEYFSDPSNRESYLQGVQKIVTKAAEQTKLLVSLDLESLSIRELLDYNAESWMIDAELFSYYLVSQPYRLQMIEDKVRSELKKRVAGSRIDLYLAKLTAPAELTLTAEEELSWARLILEGQDKKVDPARILEHYEQYKTLSLGDGNWELDPESELSRFSKDLTKDSGYYKQRIAEIEQYTATTLAERNNLIAELYIDPDTVQKIDFLAQVAHARYAMRTEGFIPLIFASGKLIDSMAPRLGYTEPGQYPYMTHEEYYQTNEAGKLLVSPEEINKRRGKDQEFMIRINNGVVEYHYGEEAGNLFHRLVPVVDHSETIEVSGVVAEHGEVEDTVTVYQWGDDMAAAMTSIKQHPILVAGQTRPSMMPIIREAKGIVTDEGGVTSHAAIVARELKIPAIINTHDATKIFKTGDLVLLDAANGIVRKVQQ